MRQADTLMATAHPDVVTFKDVEQAMVEAVELWRRSPGSGRGSPWAKDAPWDMGDQPLYGPDVDKDAPIRLAPLTAAEVAVRDAVSAWGEHAPERDRRLIWLAVNQMARTGHARPSFKELRAPMGIALGADGLRMRYNRAITAIARFLNCNEAARKAARLRR